MPKANMYQSLHTTIIGPAGRQIEIQIRTFDMHHMAEYGIASHWLYKETDKSKAHQKRIKQKDQRYMEKLSWIRQLAEGENTGQEFIDELKTDLLFDEIYVFTPKGDVQSLPTDATPVDFAYHVHTEVGNKCHGAKVNGKIVPLDTALKTGDIIEILTKKDAKPNSDWLSFVKSARTKSKIKGWITKQNKQEHLGSGQELLDKFLKELLLDPTEIKRPAYLKPVLKRYSFANEDEMYIAIGHGDISGRAVARYFQEIYQKNNLPPEEKSMEELSADKISKPKKSSKLGVSVEGLDSIMIKLANCCHPIPGDSIRGFVTMGYGITVHRTECHNIKDTKERTVDVFWSNTSLNKYTSTIEIVGFDRVGLFKDILDIIANKETNILEATAKKRGQNEIKAKITLEISDLQHLMTIITAIKSIKDIYDVYRQKS
jgi:GTP pyrophosphokinase